MSQRGQKYRVRLGFDYRLNLPKVVGSAGFDRITSDGGREAFAASSFPNV
jgi:hypothetical protein